MPIATTWYQVEIDTGTAWFAFPARHTNVSAAKEQILRVSEALGEVTTRIAYVTHTNSNGSIEIKHEVIEE